MRRISLPELPKAGASSIPPRSPTVMLSPASLLPLKERNSSPTPPAWNEAVTPTNDVSTIEAKGSVYSTVSGSSSSVGPSGASGGRGRGQRVDQCPREKRRRKIAIIIAVTAAALLVMSILLVAVSLKLTPQIDERIRKENEAKLPPLFTNVATSSVQEHAITTPNLTVTTTHSSGTTEG